MCIEAVPNRDSPPAILLRESYREAGKVKKRTLLNLSDWPHERIASERTGPRHEPRPMRLFLWSHQPFFEIKIWSRDDGSLPRHGASSGDFRVMRLRPFPKPARTAIYRDTHDWGPFPNSRILYGDDFNS